MVHMHLKKPFFTRFKSFRKSEYCAVEIRMRRVVFALLCLVAGLAHAQNKCPAEFLRLSDHHSYCQPPNGQCKMMSSNVNEADKKTILDTHNELRSRVATGKDNAQGLPTAANMLQMEWDDTLAAIAQTYAYQCLYEHDCLADGNNDCRSVPDYGVGQNLAQSNMGCYSDNCAGSDDADNKKAKWKEMIEMFYSERRFVKPSLIGSYAKNRGDPSRAWGHFTQVTWAKTWKVGCGFVTYLTGRKSMESLYVCNYGIAANLQGAPVYEAGRACSNCPTNSCCGSKCSTKPNYPGLCKLDNPSQAPQWRVDPDLVGKKLIYDCKFDDKCKFNVRNKGWQIFDRTFGRTAEIVLKGGESATMDFAPMVKNPESEFCLVVVQKKGPNLAGQAKTGVLKGAITMGDNDPWVVTLGDYSRNNYNCWKDDTTLSLTYTVPANSPPQYLEVKRVYAYLGKC